MCLYEIGVEECYFFLQFCQIYNSTIQKIALGYLDE